MKFYILIILCLFISETVSAQNDDVTVDIPKVYKQEHTDFNIELAFDPGSIFNASNGSSTFGLQNGVGIKLREFTSEITALRFGVDINAFGSNIITQQQNDATGDLELRDKSSGFGITLRPGYEWHFKGTKRLSPYIGGEVIIGWQSSNMSSESQTGSAIEKTKLRNSFSSDGLTLGAKAVTGVDFYIVAKLYLGIELSYGVVYHSQATTKLTANDGSEDEFNNGSSYSFGPDAFALFRIGYLF